MPLHPRSHIMICSHFVPKGKHGRVNCDRMDRCDVESCNGLHENQRGMRPLLCRAFLGTIPRDARAALREWIRSHSAARTLGATAALAPTTHDFCQLNE